MDHTFDVVAAKKFGILEAVILRNLQFWIMKNKANNKHQFEGRTWTYNSVKAFTEIFPYVSYDQVRYALEKLIKKEVIIKGNFNITTYDRTAWYAFKDETFWLNPQLDLGIIPNGSVRVPKPIPDYKPDDKPYILSKFLLDKIKERNPNHKEPNLQSWSAHIDRMLRIDKRDPHEVALVIKWCQNDSFWQNNILSTGGLREHYDKLKLQMEAGRGKGRGSLDKGKYERLLNDKKEQP